MRTWDRLTDNEIQHFHEGKRFNPDMFRAFVEANKFDKATYSWPKDYAKLIKDGRFSRYYRNMEKNTPPHLDHARIFKNTDTGVMCLVYHPYNYADYIREEVSQWANSNGLQADIYSPEHSWYYLGETCLVIIRKPDVIIKLT